MDWTPVRVAIVGSRDFPDLALVAQYVVTLEPADIIISGGARGVDTAACTAADVHGLQCFVYLPDWRTHGKSAGFKRNQQVVDACDELVAFWDGTSRGTKHSIDLARRAGKPVQIVAPRPAWR